MMVVKTVVVIMMMVITALLIVTVPVMQGDNKKNIHWVPSFQLFNSTIIVLIMKLEWVMMMTTVGPRCRGVEGGNNPYGGVLTAIVE